ncbi:MAG TPA: phosphatidate cytidylyltransferase, partial [Solirubrobacterales bacterium]|nr:phosphatidate cytidylyltransferase [Solirubrobacterales bacterium]
MATAETEPSKTPRAKHGLSDLPARIAVGAPALAVVVAAVIVGDAALAALLAVAAGVAAWEAMRLMSDSKAAGVTTGVLAAGVVVAVALWEREALAPAVAVAFGVLALGAIFDRREGGRVLPVLAGTVAVIWVGGGLAHAVLLRELDHGGALVLLVLVGTFVGDTAAHLLGSMFGRTPLAPSISPNKTVEGLVAGIVGGTVAIVCV